MPPPPAAVAAPAPKATETPAERPKLTNESIRQAVKEFFEESEDFCSPKAEAKWGPIAEWDVSQVTTMWQLFEHKEKFKADLSRWDVSNVKNMGVRLTSPPHAPSSPPTALVTGGDRHGAARTARAPYAHIIG